MGIIISRGYGDIEGQWILVDIVYIEITPFSEICEHKDIACVLKSIRIAIVHKNLDSSRPLAQRRIPSLMLLQVM